MSEVTAPRITIEEARSLWHTPLRQLRERALATRQSLHPGQSVGYIVNTNINYTNVCVTRCDFCSFYRPVGHPDGYVRSKSEIVQRIQWAEARGATQVLLQGGHHPTLDLHYFVELIAEIRARTRVWIHALSAPEVLHLSRVTRTSVRRVLGALKDAGLQTLPGGGAEILSDPVRRAISPLKARTADWLGVHELAHELGIRSSATMMFGTAQDGPEQWLEHLAAIRDLQDRTAGFTAFIAWTYQQGNATVALNPVDTPTYLRVIALARLFLDNVAIIQSSPLTQGGEVAARALAHGASDFGNVMLEESVVASAGCESDLTEAQACEWIERAGFTPVRRDTLYRPVSGPALSPRPAVATPGAV